MELRPKGQYLTLLEKKVSSLNEEIFELKIQAAEIQKGYSRGDKMVNKKNGDIGVVIAVQYSKDVELKLKVETINGVYYTHIIHPWQPLIHQTLTQTISN